MKGAGKGWANGWEKGVWKGDPELKLKLWRMWIDGDTVDTIARALGISRNAVIGKAHRMQLPSRPSPIKRIEITAAERRRWLIEYNDGAMVYAIARRYGRNTTTVETVLRDAGMITSHDA